MEGTVYTQKQVRKKMKAYCALTQDQDLRRGQADALLYRLERKAAGLCLRPQPEGGRGQDRAAASGLYFL